MPVPVLSSSPWLMTPPRVTAESIWSVRVAPPRSMALLNVSAPLLTILPRVMSPPMTTLFVNARLPAPAAPVLETLPALRVSVPVPKAESLAANTEPSLSVKPPA